MMRRQAAAGRGFGVGAVLLGLVSTLLALLAVEGLLRFNLDPSDLVSRDVTDPDRHRLHNELRFWQRYRDGTREFSSHDPLLGWDNRFGGSRVRDRPQIPERPARSADAPLRVVAVGDSFVFGNDVAPDENFCAVLEQNWRLEVLNMGVPGYGIDQSYLKYREYGAVYAPDIVLLGIYVHDYERTTVAFTAFAKPLFVEHSGHFALANLPVPDPPAELTRIGAAFDHRWYLPALVDDAWHRLRHQGDAAYFDEADRIIRHILGQLMERLEPTQRLLVVHIPKGNAFTDQADVEHAEMHRRLLAIYDELHVDHIDLLDAFGQVEDPTARYYVIRPSGSPSHLNPAGHRRAAELIAANLALTPR
jgi:hypothetical protein